MSVETNPTEATLSIPFKSQKHAEIAYRVLSVDQEPRRNFVQKELSLEKSILKVHLKADQVKNLRTALTSFFENLLLCQDTVAAFDLDTSNKELSKEQISEDAGTHTSTDTT